MTAHGIIDRWLIYPGGLVREPGFYPRREEPCPDPERYLLWLDADRRPGNEATPRVALHVLHDCACGDVRVLPDIAPAVTEGADHDAA